jgi:hypothetical protein
MVMGLRESRSDVCVCVCVFVCVCVRERERECVCVGVSNAVFFFSQTNTIEAYDPETNSWHVIDDFELPGPLSGAAICVL